MGFSFIHIADIHLGRPFSDLSEVSNSDELASICMNAVEKAFNNAVDIAVEKNVDFVLISGDTFDSKEQDFKSKLILKKALNKLDENNIKVFLVCGNHDPVNSYNKSIYDYGENSNIKIIGLNSEISGNFYFQNKEGNNEAVVHCFSYKDRECIENPINYFNPLSEEEKSLFNIGLLHTELNPDKNNTYAPCSKAELLGLNYDYWALGHIHIPSEIENNIIYPGTIQGRNSKEVDEHGIRYVRVQNKCIVENKFIPLDVIRYKSFDINLSDCDNEIKAIDLILNALSSYDDTNKIELVFAKINLEGLSDFYDKLNDEFYNEVVQRVKLQFDNKIVISKIENNSSPRVEENILKSDDGIIGELYKVINDENELNNIYNQVYEKLKKEISLCSLKNEEYEEFKNQVIKASKDSCINICNNVYNAEGSLNG